MTPSIEHFIPTHCTKTLDAGFMQEIEGLLLHLHQHRLLKEETIQIHAQTGSNAAYLCIRLGHSDAFHAFEFFTEDPQSEGLEGALGKVLDYGACILEEFLKEDRDAWLPLDYAKHSFEGYPMYARHRYYNLKAEKLADAFLTSSSLHGDV